MGESIPVGSYNPSEFASPTASFGEFPEDGVSSPGRAHRSNSGKFASSLPSGGIKYAAGKQGSFPASSLTTVSVVNVPPGVAGEKLLLTYILSFAYLSVLIVMSSFRLSHISACVSEQASLKKFCSTEIREIEH